MDLTISGLCEAIYGRLIELADAIAAGTAGGIDSDSKLVLCGVPADDRTRLVMSCLGGVLKIEVRALPEEMKELELLSPGSLAPVGLGQATHAGQCGPVVWKPEG